jgi:hypothetical protein
MDCIGVVLPVRAAVCEGLEQRKAKMINVCNDF